VQRAAGAQHCQKNCHSSASVCVCVCCVVGVWVPIECRKQALHTSTPCRSPRAFVLHSLQLLLLLLLLYGYVLVSTVDGVVL
jgi:hypothetical protein